MATLLDAVLPSAVRSAQPVVNINVDGTIASIQDGATAATAGVNRPYAPATADWTYAAASGGIANTTTAVTLKAAAGAGVRNYITALQVSTDAAVATATEIAIRDGAGGTVIWRDKIGTGGRVAGTWINFTTPLKSTANTLLEFVGLTASATGLIFVNAQGYSA